MNIYLVAFVVIAYFGVLLSISFLTSENADTNTFFIASRKSPWYVVAFGMVGASLSGVTFISIPGAVLNTQFSYFQVVLGYLVGYFVIAMVLLPLYYRLNLISIYSYLEQRFGFWSYKMGAFFFLLSRVIGASFRLFLAATVLHIGLFEKVKFPFELTTIISIALIWIYTRKGGIKTIVWTDTLQTAFMLLAAITSVFLIQNELDWTFVEMTKNISESEYSQIWFSGWWNEPKSFTKQFLSGAFLAIVMTGLDQDMMQKNLTCRSLGDAQKNMFGLSLTLLVVNFLFLSLGALLFLYAENKGIVLPMKDGVIITDNVYPFLAFEHFGVFAGVMFLLGLVSATYSSADSALTSLTTSFSIDFLGIEKYEESKKQSIVRQVHIAFSVVLVIVILLFKVINDNFPESNVIGSLFTAAGYTYGPLLGLFSFGLFTKRKIKDKFVPLISILSPLICYFLNIYSEELLLGYKFGFELLILNGLLTFLGLLFVSYKGKEN